MTRGLATSIALVLLIGFPPATANAATSTLPSGGRDVLANLDGSDAELIGNQANEGDAGDRSVATSIDSNHQRYLFTRVPACFGNDPSRALDGGCQAAVDACPAGEILYWLYRAPTPGGGALPQWARYDSACLAPDDPADQPVLPAMTLQDFQRLPLPAGAANVQPPNGYTLINIQTNVYADAEPTVLSTTLLGFPVQVRATPSRYAWDFGDGNVTGPQADAGAAYPDLRITNVYAEPGTYDITLTTYYTGEYSVAGGPWLPILGEAQVDSAPVAVQALAGRNQLVADATP